MKKYITLVFALAIASTSPVYAAEPLSTSNSTSGADAAAQAAGGTVNMAPITVAPVQTAKPISISGADAVANAANGPIANTATTGPSTATASPVATGTANSNATASPIVSPTISPTITGGNSSATGGNAAGGNASLQNVGNAMMNGTVSGTNTLNGNVTGTNTNNIRTDLTNQVGVSSNNANLNNIGVNATTGNNTNANNLTGGTQNQIDNSKTTNTLVGGTTNATGTANVMVGDQVLHNTTNVNASGGQGGAGGKGGESNSFSNANSVSGVNNSGNSHSTSGVTNSGNSQSTSGVSDSGNSSSTSSTSSTAQGGKVENVGNVSNTGNVVINNPKPLPPAANIPYVLPQAPTLYFLEGKPANATALLLAKEYLTQCPPTFSEVDVSEIRADGASGATKAIFTPHANYAAFKKPDILPRIQVAITPNQLPAGEYKCTCLGLLQVEALSKEASDAGFQTIINDAGIFARNKMRGYGDIRLVLIPGHSVSVNFGAEGGASGYGIAPGFSGLLNSVLATIGANVSKNTGRTFPVAQIGATFAVVAGGDIPPGAASVDFGALLNALPQPSTLVSK